MKTSNNLVFAGLFSALYLCMPTSYGALQTDETASARPLIRLATSDDQKTKGCWAGFKKAATSCLKTTKAAAQQVLPMLEFALPFIQDEELRKTMELAIRTAQKGSNLIQFNEDGSLKLPDGNELSNTVLLVFSDKVTLFTPESKMFLPLIMSLLPETDYKTKIQLTGYIATVDDASTPYLLGFEPEGGKVQLISEGTAFPVKAMSLFTDKTPVTTQEKLKTYFSEYQEASKLRTTQEASTKKRAPGSFLKSDSSILRDYKDLISKNPAFKLADLAEDILKGDFSLDNAAKALEGVAFTPIKPENARAPQTETIFPVGLSGDLSVTEIEAVPTMETDHHVETSVLEETNNSSNA
ncbi:MAG: hypothetical protein ACK5PQ_02765 [Alphaproteobacteria bacterium]